MAETYRLIFRKGLRLEDELEPGDIFLIPDIYRDARTRILPSLISRTAGKSVAIFHDAAELQLPALYPHAAPGFRSYILRLQKNGLSIQWLRHVPEELKPSVGLRPSEVEI